MGGICPGGMCPGGICPGIYVLGVMCPGGKCPGGYMSEGKCPGRTCPGGGGGVVLSPRCLYFVVIRKLFHSCRKNYDMVSD